MQPEDRRASSDGIWGGEGDLEGDLDTGEGGEGDREGGRESDDEVVGGVISEGIFRWICTVLAARAGGGRDVGRRKVCLDMIILAIETGMSDS